MPDRLEKLHITVFVYGTKYVDLFRRVVLPNLASLIGEVPPDLRPGTTFKVITDAPGKVAIEAAPALKEISSIVAVELSDDMIEDLQGLHGRHGPMLLNQERFVRDASAVGAGIIFCPPDLIWSHGSFAKIISLARHGSRVVIAPSIRAIEEDLVPVLEASIARDPHGRLSLSDEEMTKSLFEHWQQMNDGFFWKDNSYYWKSYVYFKVGPRQFVVKFFQGPTMFAWPHKVIQNYKSWIDHRLIKQCARSPSEVHVIADGHELMTLDIAQRRRSEELRPVTRLKWALLRQLLDRKTHSSYNLLMGRHNCRVYDAALPQAEWRRAERAFDRAVTPIIYLALFLRPLGAVFSAMSEFLRIPSLLEFAQIHLRKIPVVRNLVISLRRIRDR